MKLLHAIGGRKIRFVLLAGLCLLTVLQLRRQSEYVEPPEGMVIDLLNPPPQEKNSGGKLLGNPENGIADFKKIYQCLLIYKQKFRRYPANEMDLLSDMGANFADYGLNKGSDAMLIFTNPDTAHWPFLHPQSRPDSTIIYHMDSRRLDGKPIGGPKPNGQRDVLVWTELYFFPNRTMNWAKPNAGTMNPAGFYLVLWDDGQIEKIPFQQRLYVPQGTNNWVIGFPGQAGLLPGAQTFEEHYRDSPAYQNWKRTLARKHKTNAVKS